MDRPAFCDPADQIVEVRVGDPVDDRKAIDQFQLLRCNGRIDIVGGHSQPFAPSRIDLVRCERALFPIDEIGHMTEKSRIRGATDEKRIIGGHIPLPVQTYRERSRSFPVHTKHAISANLFATG